MSEISVIFGLKRNAKVGIVTFDASVTETHTKENEVTDHPVETGADITDHVRRRPEELEMEVVVSNHPVVILASLTSTSPLDGDFTNPVDRVGTAYQELRRLMNAAELVTVVTTLRQYENMVISGMAVTRDKDNGNVLAAKLSLREIILATTEQVAAPVPKQASNQGVKNLGKKATKPADASQDASANTSVLKGVSNWVGDQLGL